MARTLQELQLDDDFLFAKVMSDEKICKMVLETILKIEIEKVELLVEQNSIQNVLGSKGVRLDVYVKDDKGTVFVCEMQNGKKKELPKRVRYYQGSMDLDLIAKGAKYTELKQSFIIFICTFDPFGQNRYSYTFQETCAEDKDLLLGDETQKVFLNTKGSVGESDENLKEFLGYVEHTTQEYAEHSASTIVKALHEKVTAVKESKEMEVAFMTTLLWEQDIREESEKLGEKRGEQRGEQRATKKWQNVVAEKDAVLAEKDALIAELQAKLKN